MSSSDSNSQQQLQHLQNAAGNQYWSTGTTQGLNLNQPANPNRNVIDALMLARLQQNQDHQHVQQQDSLRRLSIDTIGSSQRSVGVGVGVGTDSASGLISAAGRINPNSMQNQSNMLQNQLLESNNQLLNTQQRGNDWSQLMSQQAGGSAGLYPRSGSLSFLQNYDQSSVAASNLRLQQQGLAGIGASDLSWAGGGGGGVSQSRLPSNMFPGNQLDLSNTNANSALEMDLIYRALLQQQQQGQPDNLLNLQRPQQQLINDLSFAQDAAAQGGGSRNTGMESQSIGGAGFDNMNFLGQQNRLQQQLQQQQQQMRQDPLDWSRNSNSNLEATLFALQQQQQQQQQQQSALMQQLNYQNNSSMGINQRMSLEEQLAMANAMWNNPSVLLNSQQQNPLLSMHGSSGLNNSTESDVGTDGMGSASLLSALFADSSAPYEMNLPFNASAASNSAAAISGTGTSTSKATKAATEESAQLPVRALSAYNFFFRDERDRIINSDDDFDPTVPSTLTRRRNAAPLNDAKKQQLLNGHWYRDRTVKRRHRKTHGKIAFTALSKVISQAWRDLPETEKAFYRDVAAEDLERYQRELEQYKVADNSSATPKSFADIQESKLTVNNDSEPPLDQRHDIKLESL